MTDVAVDRVRTLIDAYGADPDRWPAAERDAALRIVETDPTLAAELADARALDRLLDAVPAPLPNPALKAALKAVPERARLRWSDRLAAFWPFGAPWRPAAGLAAAALVGIVVGLTAPDGATGSGQEDGLVTVAYDPVSAVAAMASGAGALEYLQ